MSRGLFSFLQNQAAYTESEKDWYVELISSWCFWYDLIISPPEGCDTNRHIIGRLKQMQDVVESELDKRFIYFLAARKKIRFCVKRKPRYSLFGYDLILYIEIGRDKVLKKVATKVFDSQSRQPIKPHVEISDRFITFHCSPTGTISKPIHEFLIDCGIELGISTEIHYIGYTKNPSKRPVNRSHRGLTDMFYKISNEDHDFFVFYNLFKVMSISNNSSSPLKFCVANSMIDEVKVDLEGRIIEKALIHYFNTELQEVNKQSEETELINSLGVLANVNKINSITIHIEMDEQNEQYRFFSRSVNPAYKHIFRCCIGNNSIETTEGTELDFTK